MTAVLILFGSFSCTRDMITTDDIGRETNGTVLRQADDLPEDISGPYLFIPERDFDFGYTFQHSKVSHKFRFYSAGDDTLRILNIRPG
jgi:hypothetical protein